MGYLYLSFSLLAGAAKGYCGKKITSYTKGYKDTMLVNIIRMLLCVAIGTALLFLSGNQKYIIAVKHTTLMISAISGFSTAMFVVCWLTAIKQTTYMLLEIFLTLSLIVPLALSNILFAEHITFMQWLGFLVLLMGVFIMYSYNSGLKDRINIKMLIVLILCGLSNGIADFSQKIFVKHAVETPIMVFNFYTYIFSAIGLLIAYSIFNKYSQNKRKHQPIQFKTYIYIYILVMSICLFAHSYFKTSAANFLNAIVLYPVTQGGALIVSSIMAAICFGEKITAKSLVGSSFAFLGLVIINML